MVNNFEYVMGRIIIEIRAIDVVLEAQIMFKSKAQVDSKAEHTRKYVSIFDRLATQLLDI